MYEPRCLDDRSWEDIKRDVQNVVGQYRLGDFKNDALTDGTPVQLRIIGINHDISAEGKPIPLTWEMVDCLPERYPWHRGGGGVRSFPDTTLWHELNDIDGVVYNLMPLAIRNLLVPAVKKTFVPGTNEIIETVDSFWIKSEQETFGRQFFSGPGEGRWYEWYAQEGTPWYKKRSGGSEYTMLRSPRRDDADYFCYVLTYGTPNYYGSGHSIGLPPAFAF